LVRPDSAGTCTLPEAPSFAWRTNTLAVTRRGHSMSLYVPRKRHLVAVGWNGCYADSSLSHRHRTCQPVPGGSVAHRRASLAVIAEEISLMLHLLLELLLMELEERTEVELSSVLPRPLCPARLPWKS
jgi:hypothetical protein